MNIIIISMQKVFFTQRADEAFKLFLYKVSDQVLNQ